MTPERATGLFFGAGSITEPLILKTFHLHCISMELHRPYMNAYSLSRSRSNAEGVFMPEGLKGAELNLRFDPAWRK
jgi:hypothetical protein